MAEEFNYLGDIKLQTGPKALTTRQLESRVRHMPHVRPRTIRYKRGSIGYWGEGWIDCVYDLAEVARVADIESALSNSIRRHRELLMKEGSFLHGKNDRAKRAVEERIQEISITSGKSWNSTLRELATNLIKYHSAFLILRRDRNRSTGRPIRFHGKRLDPIAAIECADPTTMQVKQNKSGGITGWRQYVPEQGEEREFNPEDVIIVTMDRKTGFVFGTPYCLPVLDDIYALRRLEELADVITTKHAFPLYHYRVGTEDHPAQEYMDESGNRISEVDTVRAQIVDMPTEGAIVTSERHEVVVIGAEGQAMDLTPYLEHYKNRVNEGLRLSGVDRGSGGEASKATAVVVAKSMTEAVRDYQAVLEDELTFQFFNIILWEEGYDLSPENQVWLRFPAVDREEERAHENHQMGLYQGYMMTEDEARQRMGMEPMKNKAGSFLQIVSIPLVKAGKTENKAGSSISRTKKKTSSKTQPKNQHKKSATKPSPSTRKNDMVENFDSQWGDLRRIVTFMKLTDATELRRRLEKVDSNLLHSIQPYASYIMDRVTNNAFNENFKINNEIKNMFFRGIAKKRLRKITSRTIVMLRKANTLNEITSSLDAMRPVVLSMVDQIRRMAIAFALLEGAKRSGMDKFRFKGLEFNTQKTHVRDLAGVVK